MKKYIKLSFLLLSVGLMAQLGINTNNPQQIFHIDGGKDANTMNPTTGVPTLSQQVDDFVVTSNGSIGVGTINPTHRLEINNQTNNGAIRIQDGSEGFNKMLVSDQEGVGTWVLPNAMKSVIVGRFEKTSTGEGIIINSDQLGWKYSNVSIKLTKGVWMINLGLTMKSFIKSEHGAWVHLRLSSTSNGISYTGWKNLGTAQNNTSFAGALMGSAVFNATNDFQYFLANSNNYLSGSNIIEVENDEVTLYLMIENFSRDSRVPTSTTQTQLGTVWQFSTSNWENYFYANPL